MKKLLTILSFLIAMICGNYEAEAQQCLCDDLMAGDTCCFTSVINYNGCPITYTACFRYDTLNSFLSLETKQLIIADSCDFPNLVDLQDSISYSILADQSMMPQGRCWGEVPDCPAAMCGFNVNYFTCYKKVPMESSSGDTLLLAEPCRNNVMCIYFEGICKDENGIINIHRGVYSPSGTCETQATPHDPNKEYECISSCTEE